MRRVQRRSEVGIFDRGGSGATTKCGRCGKKMKDVSGTSPMELMGRRDVSSGLRCAACGQTFCDCGMGAMMLPRPCKCGSTSFITFMYSR